MHWSKAWWLPLLLLVAMVARAESVRTPHVEADLIADRTAIEAGKTLTVALRLKMIPHWHTYWRNPGDAGLATSIDWTLPPGFTAGDIQWPPPSLLPAGPLMNYGYENEVYHLIDITAPSELPAGPLTLGGRASWLVCNEETCIPEGGNVSITLPSGPGSASSEAASIDFVRNSLPQPATGWTLRAASRAAGAVLEVTGAQDVTTNDIWYYPYAEGLVEPSGKQLVARLSDGFQLTIPAAEQPIGPLDRLHGVIVIGGTAPRAFEIDTTVGAASTVTDAPGAVAAGADAVAAGAPGATSMTLLAALAFAVLGGLILNLMPCVLPVISVKILGFVEQGGADVRATRKHGLAFASGILVCMWALAGLLLALRGAGNELGWGYQMQSPAIITLLALFFFGLALNLSDVYHFRLPLPDGVATWSARNKYLDSFGSGVLTVFVAAPCTAPFMGAALGYAFSSSALTALLVFTALGLGMSLPYVLLAWFPGWLERMPRPGMWMVRLKQFLAFPIYATVIWLIWVLGQQASVDAVVSLLIGLLVLGLAAWCFGNRGRYERAGALLSLALAGVAVWVALPNANALTLAAEPTNVQDAWQPFEPAKIDEYLASGRPVFVDFTAAWCATCQVNKRLVLSTSEVMQAFDAKAVHLMRADWTRRDAVITRALEKFGRNGVPVYVLYRPGREPELLPEVLTRDIVTSALADLRPSP